MNTLSPVLGFLSMNGGEMFFIMFLCLLFFGSKKLPDLAKAMGQSVREFKKAANDVEENFHSAVREEERKKAATPPPPAPGTPVLLPPAQSTTPPPAEKL